MRPIKLTLSAFGPYAGLVELPMEQLGEQGLYLITGDTGAGKTTIFDGICYALFGEASGNVREPGMMRSKYAEDDTPTFVELEFLYRGKTYTIRRNPDYERPSKRGEKVVKERTDAVLTYPDGHLVTKPREVNQAVYDLLGVDKNQFSQISMIAQGDFLKLLLADTKERQGIFREIFQTKMYQDFQQKCKGEAAALENQCSDGRKSIAQYIQGILCSEEDFEKTELEEAKAGSVSTERTLELLDLVIAKDQKRHEERDAKEEEKKKELAGVNTILGKAEEQEKSRAGLMQAKNDKKLAETELKHWDEVYTKEKELQPQQEEYLKEKNLLERQLVEFDEVASAVLSWKQRNVLSEKNVADIKVQEAECGKKKQELDDWKKELKTFLDLDTGILKIKGEMEQIKRQKDVFTQLQSDFEVLQKQEVQLKTAQEAYGKARTEAEEKEHEYNENNRRFYDEQAGILASTLKEGNPCPVCGAISHPSLAKTSKEAPTQAELESLRILWQKASQTAVAKSQEAGQTKGTRDLQYTLVSEKFVQLFGSNSLEQGMVRIQEKIQELQKEYQKQEESIVREEARRKHKEELEAQIPIREQWVSTQETSLRSRKDEANLTYGQLKEEQKQLASRQQKLTFQNRQEFTNKISVLQQQISERKVAFETAQTKHTLYEKQVANAQTLITQLEQQLTGAQEINIENEKLKQNELNIAIDTLEKEKQEIYTRISTNTFAKGNIEKGAKNLSELEAHYTWMRVLSDTVSGNLTGKEKIMLETYIQMTYFDRILIRANQRLQIMSDGQYTLIRRQETEKIKSQSGLDLDVIDHYNGTHRSVKTLSGGESFKASLCLALALSDEVQSQAGGIQLDTMFVDEGFGSLDEESLQQAITALADLGEGNRLVGIISHVGELKSRIDHQIVVTKTPEGGSKAVIV